MKKFLATVLTIGFYQISLYAQDGSLDLSFDPGSGFDLLSKSVAVQSDGKIIVGGWFTEFDGVSRNGIARLNADGSLDTSFDPGSGAQRVVDTVAYAGQVNEVLIQPNGKIVVGGGFSHYNGVSSPGIVRLNADGTMDQSFDVGQGLDLSGTIYEMVLQSDGKIIIGGNISSYDGIERKAIARINADGSLDQNFYPNPSVSFAGQVLALGLQPDGKILAGGWFDEFETSQAANIVRLNSDGTMDASFDCGTGVNAYGIEDFAIQPDGRIIITGQYDEVNGAESIMISRLLADGTLDNTFQMDTAIGWYSGVSLQLQPDNKIILGGWLFGWPNGQDTAMNIVRLNVDGSIDQSFDPGSGVDGGATIWDIALQSDGKILLAGVISHVDGVPRNFIARLNNSSISSVSESKPQPFLIYPNPSNGQFTLQMSTNEDCDVQVFNTLGQSAFSKQFNSTNKVVIELPSTGVYHLVVRTEAEVYTQKVVVSQ